MLLPQVRGRFSSNLEKHGWRRVGGSPPLHLARTSLALEPAIEPLVEQADKRDPGENGSAPLKLH